MRTRLFALLVVPVVAVSVLAGFFVDERSDRYRAAQQAFAAARLAEQVAALDQALGTETLAASRLARGAERFGRAPGYLSFSAATAATDAEMANVNASLNQARYHPDLVGAVEAVEMTLAFRSDVSGGLVSPLQILDRYSHIRGLLLDALAAQALAVTSPEGQQGLLVLVDLIEARSAHLIERVAVEVARRNGKWAPGLQSAMAASVAAQTAHLDNANRFLFGQEIEPSALLTSWRTQIAVTNAAPIINARVWTDLSDGWLAELTGHIEQQAVRTMNVLSQQVETAERARLAGLVGVGGTVVLALLIASVVSVGLVRRVSIITRQARRMAAGLDTERISPEVQGSDELGLLAEAFDEMTSQIETRATNQWIESTVLEAIVQGAPVETVLEYAAPLLGVTADGRPLYRFCPEIDHRVLVEPTEAGIEMKVPGEPISIEQLAGIPEARTALGLARMVKQRDEDHHKLAWQASRDELTGLLNRGAILAEALGLENGEGDEGSYPGLLYVDLDGFKAVNDQFGHAAGDRVLVAQAERLAELADRCEGRVGRLGGDEFLLIAPGLLGHADLVDFADTVVDELDEAVVLGSGSYQVSASVGGVLVRPDVAPLRLLNDADAALYDAKRLGRARAVVSTQALRDRIAETDLLRQDVISGLQTSQFKPWYQPIWADDGLSLAGMEALARWEHPERRVVPPSVFLPVAEELHLLSELDRVVFEAVCRQVVAWRAAGHELGAVHYNLSTAWLEDPDFVADTTRILEQTGCPPSAIVAEVTESRLMTDVDSNIHRLQKLREVGIRVAVDDFGQGYSSLAYLSELPVDLLKIDRRFVDMVDQDRSNQAIVSAIIRLGRTLGLRIIAEGVERQEELDFLSAAGCDLYQGYLLARPAPGPEATAILGRGRRPFDDRPEIAPLPGTALWSPASVESDESVDDDKAAGMAGGQR